MKVDRAGDWLRGLRPQAWIRVPRGAVVLSRHYEGQLRRASSVLAVEEVEL